VAPETDARRKTMAIIEWLGHATFRIKDGVTIYIDPWKLKGNQEKADLILISHSHYDHLSPEDVEKITKADTVIVASDDCRGKLKGTIKTLNPGGSLTERGVKIQGVASYNPAKQFHPKKNNWLGFLVTVREETIYYAGDTDLIPEMEQLGTVDTALLPVGGTYTMSADEAAEAAKRIKPKRCIPYHYGDIVGSESDAEKFKKLCGCPTEILKASQ